jgi:cytochrome c biogenesis factor
LKSDSGIISRGTLVSATVLAFSALAVLITIGMLTPLIVKFATGMELSMDAEYFNLRTAPFAIFLTLALPACLLAGRYSQKQVVLFFGCVLAFSVSFLLISPTGDWKSDVFLPLFAGSFSVVLYRLGMLSKERTGKALFRGIGAHIIHIGILLIIFGVIASSTMKMEDSAVFTEDVVGSFENMDCSIKVTDMSSGYEGNPYGHYPGSSYVTYVGFDIYRSGVYFDSGTLEYITDIKWKQTYTTTYVHRGFFEELFIAPRALDEDNHEIDLYVRIVPFITFVWGGIALLILGMLILLISGLLPERPALEGGAK